MKTATVNIGAVLRHPAMFLARLRKRGMYLDSIDVACVKCAESSRPDRALLFSRSAAETSGLMSRETFSTAVRPLLPFCGTVNFVGCGEPLLNGELPWMIRMVKSYGRDARLTTSGIFLDEGKICELIGAGVDSIAVSLDGAAPLTHDARNGKGSFARTVRNLVIFRRVKNKMGCETPPLIINTVITEDKRGEIMDILTLARNLGAAEVSLSHPRPFSGSAPGQDFIGSKEIYKPYYNEWREKAVSLGIGLKLPGESPDSEGQGRSRNASRRVAIAWDGNVSADVFSSA